MVNVPKHGPNLNAIAFIMFIGHCKVNWVGKSPSYSHEKSWDCLLTHWMPMKTSLFLIETIQRYQFRCNFLKQNISVNFWLHFRNLDSILKISEKKMIVTAFVFPKLRTVKTCLDKCLKSPVSEDASTSNMVNVSEHGSHLHHLVFIMFINNFQVNWVKKNPYSSHAKSSECLLTHRPPMKSILFLIETI